MRALQSRPSKKRHLGPECHQALQLLARSPRGATEDMLVLAGLATVVTEMLRAGGPMIKVERMQITDAGRRALEG